MSATSFSPVLVPAAPVRSDWRGRLAGWLARMAAPRWRPPAADMPVPLGNHLSRDMGLPPGPSHEDKVWGAGGLLWR